jgi:hypothetical protein
MDFRCRTIRRNNRNSLPKPACRQDRHTPDLTITLQTLCSTSIAITVQNDDVIKLSVGNRSPLPLIQYFDFNDVTKKFTFTVDPRWSLLFSNKEYAFIDFNKRLQFGLRQDMGKTLQRLIATSSDRTQRYSLVWLKDKLHFKSPMRKFKEALPRAFRELERLEIIAGAHVGVSTKGKEQAVWTRL